MENRRPAAAAAGFFRFYRAVAIKHACYDDGDCRLRNAHSWRGETMTRSDDLPLRQDRSRPLLRRQRPAVGVLLPQRLRLRRRRLRRPRNESQARGRLRPAAGRHHLRAHLAAVGRAPREPAAHHSTATASWTSPSTWPTCGPTYRSAVERGGAGVEPPDAARRRVRRLRVRDHPHLRRHDAHVRQPRPLPRRLRPGLSSRSTRNATARRRSTGRPGGDRPHRRQRRRRQDERVGRLLPARCSASSSSCRSTTRTSAPSTRR